MHPGNNLTRDEARRRAQLIQTPLYDISLDLTRDSDTFTCEATIHFLCQEPGADTFIAYSYPPDTFMLTNTAITQSYNPKIFYTAVGTAFAAYGANFKDKANGVLGIGGWDPTLPGAQEYVQRQMDPIRNRVNEVDELSARAPP